MKNYLQNVLIAMMLSAALSPTQAQIAPPLGVAASFVLFSSNGAVSNGAASNLRGNVGNNGGGSVTGFGNVNGRMHVADGTSAAAASDLNLAYNNIAGQAATVSPSPLLGGGQVLTPAVYGTAALTSVNGLLQLDGLGNTNACFIFKIGAAFSTGVSAKVELINGTQACNVFWSIDGAASMATNTTFAGTIITNGALAIASGSKLDGRGFSVVGAVTVSGVTAGTPIGCGSPTLLGPTPPTLGATVCYALLTANGGVSSTGARRIWGDIGTNSGSVSGFDPLLVAGTLHPIPDASTAQASADMGILRTYLNSLTPDIELLFPVQLGSGLVLTPHVYVMNGAAHLTDTLFLDAQGSSNAVFVLRINGALTTEPNVVIALRGGAQSKNIFWQVEGAITVGNDSKIKGTLLANNGAITLAIGDTLDGRALSTTGAISSQDVTSHIYPTLIAITPGGPTTFSSGGSVTLTASSSVSYLWSGGETTQSVVATTSGDYTVTVTNSDGCTARLFAVTVTVTPLPITLLDFAATVNRGQVELQWATAAEVDNDFFTVEKAVEGLTFYPVAQTDGAGTTDRQTNYSAIDPSPTPGASYYRLKQTDFDGKFAYSSIVEVSVPRNTSFSLTVYPNPVRADNINVIIAGANGNRLRLTVSDLLGRQCYSEVLTPTSDNHTTPIARDKSLAPGVYVLVAWAGNAYFTQKMVVE